LAVGEPKRVTIDVANGIAQTGNSFLKWKKAFIIANATAPLFLTTQQLSLWIPNLQAVPVNYVMICPQRFGGFDRQFERLKRLQSMAAVSRYVKRSV
jgi:hypothetical protein